MYRKIRVVNERAVGGDSVGKTDREDVSEGDKVAVGFGGEEVGEERKDVNC